MLLDWDNKISVVIPATKEQQDLNDGTASADKPMKTSKTNMLNKSTIMFPGQIEVKMIARRQSQRIKDNGVEQGNNAATKE